MHRRHLKIEPFQKPLLDDDRLPRWLPDETLHSWLCRYHQVSGGSSREVSCRRLFGLPRWRSRHDFPFHLAALQERSGGLIGTARSVALERTIVKLFLPFIPSERCAAVLKAMAVPDEGSIAAKIGLLRSGVSSGHPLKACPHCLVDDLKSYHTPYWHRIHQCPGVWVCPIHRCELLVADDEEATPWEWYLPTEGRLKTLLREETIHAERIHQLLHLADLVDGALSLPEGIQLDPIILRNVVIEQLRNRDLATEYVVRRQALAALYIRTWNLIIIEPYLLPFRTDVGALSRWLGRLLEKGFIGYHPLAWLTLIGLFFENWSEFAAAYAAVAVSARHQKVAVDTSAVNFSTKQSEQPVRHRLGSGQEKLYLEVQETHRMALDRYRKMYPNASRTLLRQKCRAAYLWLLKNDGEWFESRLPPSKSLHDAKVKTFVGISSEPQLSLAF